MNERHDYENPEPLPFERKRAEIRESNAHGMEVPRCPVCGEIIQNLNPFQKVTYCSRTCRKMRTAKGQKKMLKAMKRNKLL